MPFMEERRARRLGAREFVVPVERARDLAQFQVYAGIAARSRGFGDWEVARLPARPRIVYDLSGLPLFYDFPVRKGRGYAGFTRVAANSALGEPFVGVQVTPEGWSLATAKEKLAALLRRRYRAARPRRVRLVSYSYPKLALQATLGGRGREQRTVLMDVADFTEVPTEPGSTEESIGQVAYSLLDRVPEAEEERRRNLWRKVDDGVAEALRKKRNLRPDSFYRVARADRLRVLDRAFAELEIIKLYTERILDFCCHAGGCRDHECFCLHPQENNVHCARAAGQMMLCFWRYCFSQHQIAQAYGVADNVGTPPGAIVGGLESLTNNCFDSTRHNTASWADYVAEIQSRRPFMSCVPGHARACAGTKQWNIWIMTTPQPRYLYIFDPWPPNTGAIYWENFNTTNYSTSYAMYTLERRTTTH